MKIAFLVRNYNKRSGISRHVAEIAERFAVRDEVHIYTSTVEDVDSNRIVFFKVPIISIPLLKKFKKYAWNNIFEIVSFAVAARIRMKMSGHAYDIVHSQGDYPGMIDVFTAHSCHMAWLAKAQCEQLTFWEKIKKSRWNPLHAVTLLNEKCEFKNSSKIISVSKGVKNEISEFYGIASEKIVTIPNGVDLERFSPRNREGSRERIRKLHAIADDDFVIIFPAHEFRRKGLSQVIEAVKIAGKEEIHVLVIGRDDAAYYQELAKKLGIHQNIHFIGNRSNIQEYFAASDLMIFPTLYEAFSLATLESIASGVPLLCTNVNGTEEILQDQVNGLIVRRDPADIAQKLLRVYENRDELTKYGVAARHMAERYSWDNIASRTREVYESIILQRRMRGIFGSPRSRRSIESTEVKG